MLVRVFRWSDSGLPSTEFLFTTLGGCYGLLSLATIFFLLYIDNIGIGVMLTIACALRSALCHAHLCRVDADLAPFLSAHLVFAVTLAIPLFMFRAVGCRMATHAIPFDFTFSRI